MNSIAPEPLKGLEPKITQIFPLVGPQVDKIFKVIGQKVKVIENILKIWSQTVDL